MSTTTPECPANWFCTNPPDESSYLYGPYRPNPTLLLTRGKCILQYNMNYQTGKLDPANSPQLITSYFPGPGGPTAPFPLSMNYMTPDPATNNQTYILNMIGPWSQKALSCSVSPAKPPATAPTCPEAADVQDINVQDITNRFSSASSQLNYEDGLIYQFVVNKRKSNGRFASTRRQIRLLFL
ncbi:hypothetical protein RvY_01337-2 [Ramazzottius varieornatus]|uniref:Uncharacterized protein n=1 Tax=Ramazzottius varieornatus TaxID=947166 RepID=A0A1D1UGV6_RAMVA|nr:hypothetical protein RvY_01337-2 [Ramazzottius varieornatus]